MIKYISFDLDGALSNERFDKVLWNEELPKLYAKEKGVNIHEAEQYVFAEFYRALFVEKIHNFTDVEYWFRRHNLNNWEELLYDMRKHFYIYDDAKALVEYLKVKYKLVIISSSERSMLDVKLKNEQLVLNFERIFSTPSDFKISMKNKEAFLRLLHELGIGKEELIHIGDSKHMDLESPKAVGIQSYLIDRERRYEGKENVVHSLLELKEIL